MTKENFLNKNQDMQAKLNEMFPNIAGYDKVRAEGAQIIDIILRKEEYLKVGARCPRGWFFYGDPGMGKTQLVKDISSYVDYPIIEISTSDAIKRKVSIDEDVVKGFEEAKRLGKCIVFIDEMDKFAGYKKYVYEVTENLKTQKILLHELDEVKDCDDIIVVATGNKKDYLNETVLRSGRFDRQIMFYRPNEEDREAIIKHFLKDAKLAKNATITDLVKMTAGRSCADIECMVNEAKIALVHKNEDELYLGDFVSALNRIIYSDIPKDEIVDKEQSKMVAYHEVGHALMGYLLQPEKVHYVSIIPQGNSAGNTKMNGDDDAIKKKSYYEEIVKISLAGMIAVRLMTGTMTNGNKSDIETALTFVRTMLDEGFYGLENTTITINKDTYGEGRYSSALSIKRGEKMMEIINSLSTEVEDALTQHVETLEKLAQRLVEKRELSKQEIVAIIEEDKIK